MIFLPLLLLPFIVWAWPHLSSYQAVHLVVMYVFGYLWFGNACLRWARRR